MIESLRAPTLFSVIDPMCSWCWGFHKNHQIILNALPKNVDHHYVLGGLAPDSSAPMPKEMQRRIQNTWRRVSEVTQAPFNFDFWEKTTPRRSTYLSCRAVLAAKQIDHRHEAPMIAGIQRAYYQDAQNPSDEATLIKVAQQIGISEHVFTQALCSDDVLTDFAAHQARARQLGATSFPTLVLVNNGLISPLVVGYSEAGPVVEWINDHVNP